MAEDRPWLKNYPNGMPANIDVEQYPNLVTFFDESFKKYSDKVAYENLNKTMTFRELDTYSNQFAAYLQSRGLERGDKVAIMMPNLLQYPIAIIGVLKAGLIAVNTNPLYTTREMHHQFTDSDVKGIIILENFCSNLEKIIGDTPIKTVIVTSIGEMLGLKGIIVNLAVRKIKKMVPKFNLANTVNFKTALKEGKKFKLNKYDSDLDDTVIHQYTGGTTGVSKGAELTNRNLLANMLQMKACMDSVLKEGGEVSLSPLPMYHIFAFTVNCLAMTSLGAHTILVTNPRDLPSIFKEFNNSKVTLFSGLNTLFNGMMNHPDFDKTDFSHLKVTIAGGMAVQKAVAEEWKRRTKCDISEGYGMTESSPVISVNPLKGGVKLGTIGMPVPSTEIRIVDEQGNILPQGEIGEITARGPQVMKGYYKRPDETAKTLKDGWLYTGDIGMVMEDGYMKIVDRKKDMILVSGFNVYPNEIEDEIVKHPKVLECAAIGIPSEKSGEVVKVFVVKKDASLTEDEVIEHCRTCMTGYKVPKAVEFRDELPKSNVGKILRRKLRE